MQHEIDSFKPPTQETSGPDEFTTKFYQTLKVLIWDFTNYYKNVKIEFSETHSMRLRHNKESLKTK